MNTFRRVPARSRRQTGLTLVELMVALALGMLIAAAAVSALIVARQGFRSVDTGAQLRENARFAASLIQRVVVQAGFENAAYGLYTDPKDPGLEGYDNALVKVTSPTTAPTLATDSRTAAECGASDTSCLNGSDVLVVRYWGVGPLAAPDGTMINCSGRSEPEGTERAFSIFHVLRSNTGEPTLACTYLERSVAPLGWKTVPLVTGVESFQVLYGVDTLTAGGAAAATPADGDTVADVYRTARELGTSADNWRRVRNVRVGLVIRSATADAADRALSSASMPVLGADDRFVDAADIGSSLTPTTADGRLRQRMVFTVHLRNAQYAP